MDNKEIKNSSSSNLFKEFSRSEDQTMSKRTREAQLLSPVRKGSKLLERSPSGDTMKDIQNVKTMKQLRKNCDIAYPKSNEQERKSSQVPPKEKYSQNNRCPFLTAIQTSPLYEADSGPVENGTDYTSQQNNTKQKKIASIPSNDNILRDVNNPEFNDESNNDKIPKQGTVELPSVVIHPQETPDDMSPLEYAKEIVKTHLGVAPEVKEALSLPEGFFPSPTQEQIQGYTMEMIDITRENRVQDLKKKIDSGSVTTLELCNRFGESLIHLACRRGNKETVHYLLNEGKVSVRCRDDVGRTPLHDTCWNPKPQLEIFEELIARDPILLFVSDKRGSTPFHYARREHWSTWKSFLYSKRTLIKPDQNLVLKHFTR